ncbi:hypothetical protein HH214_06465 [Mucilaginibacter robiniae]|uniref:Carboxypeptidase regulatory-like domain-containing protein n=1 Tax=Mucilaginibacter robiniae TaxID=2728022 RepID=A0A7L5DZS8_9SPHI|nr:hypothetical protein [Mucilaginibacter robiniae]QJD95539.1 hypothetical protein HH214_06465 [Mucilaginibacter robiniae]
MLKFISKLFLAFSIASVLVITLSSMFSGSIHLSSGIEGHIYQATGNHMPMRGKAIEPSNKSLNCRINIYQATTIAHTTGHLPLFTQINTHLVASLHTDSTGYYQVKLPVGKYSVFIRQDSSYFAAETDGQGILNPVEVKTQQLTRRDFTVTLQAAY